MVNPAEALHIIYSYDTSRGDEWALDKFALIAGNRIARTFDSFDRIENQFGLCTAKREFNGTTYIRVALPPEDYAVMDSLGDSIGPVKREDYPALVDVITEEGTIQVPNREPFICGTQIVNVEGVDVEVVTDLGVWM